MTTVPLKVYGDTVGHALVDDDLADVASDHFTWTVVLPRKQQRQVSGRPDVLRALLKEDSNALSRAHPFMWIGKQQLRLSRVALRPELLKALREHVLFGQAKYSTEAIISIRDTVQKVMFLNGNRCDCRRENLRELTSV